MKLIGFCFIKVKYKLLVAADLYFDLHAQSLLFETYFLSF